MYNNNEWNVLNLPKPWEANRIPLYVYVKHHSQNKEKFPEDFYQLPDEDTLTETLRWAPGAQDGVILYHTSPNRFPEKGQLIYAALKTLIQEPSYETVTKFYRLLIEEKIITFVDDFLNCVFSDKQLESYKVLQLAEWLVVCSPDREAIKLGLAILGLSAFHGYTDYFTTMGKHDEFTFFAMIALSNTLENADVELWKLAQFVEGWGRVHIIRRLSQTVVNQDIKKWLLCEGYRNSVMHEYLAYACASSGNLVGVLRSAYIEEQELVAAGEIIKALLIECGPVETIKDYGDGAEAITLYLEHIGRRKIGLQEISVLESIKDFVVKGLPSWDEKDRASWTQAFQDYIVRKVTEILMLHK